MRADEIAGGRRRLGFLGQLRYPVELKNLQPIGMIRLELVFPGLSSRLDDHVDQFPGDVDNFARFFPIQIFLDIFAR
jgi:hypothetical protein